MGAEHLFFFARGRVALYAALKAMELGPGDEILLPGYTCVMVPAAPLALGIRPVYVDIDPRTYALRPELLEAHVSDRTRAVVAQHSYGIPCRMDQLAAWAQRKRLVMIEDCCHAFGSRFQGKLCGAFGEAAFFSGQWNKPFSTGLGGILAVREDALAERVREIIKRELIRPAPMREAYLAFQIRLHRWLVRPWTTPLITWLYRGAAQMGIAIGSSTPEEFQGILPKQYFMGMARVQIRKGIQEMKIIGENIAHRRQMAAYYAQALGEAGLALVLLEADEDPVFLRYPVRVKNKRELLARAFRQGVEIGSWFDSPLHPEEADLERFGYILGSCPEAERATREVINLPTHPQVTMREAERIMQFIRRHAIPAALRSAD